MNHARSRKSRARASNLEAQARSSGCLDQVGQLADLNLSCIGQLDKKSEPYGVECMHGIGDPHKVQQLCAAKHFQGQSGEINPWADWWNFIQCVNYGPASRIGNENVAKSCAGRHQSASVQWIQCHHDGTWKSCEEGHEVGDLSGKVSPQQEWKRLNSVI
ncbi:hypothetical protein ACM66B_002427 [Microbotryomycetes sp. NB124-2]